MVAIMEGEMLRPSEIGPRPVAPADQRKIVHDLRNLFAIIGAGTSLLERDPSPARRKEVLFALEEATRQGARLTTDLLANCADKSHPVIVDVGERLAKLEPTIRVMTNAQVDLAPLRGHCALVCIVPADFDAVIVEMVSNAVAAGATAVAIRAHSCGDSVWVLVSDNGCGMSAVTRARAYRGSDLGMAHGTGLSRIRQFMELSGGDLRIRSRPGGGTQIGLIFPASGNASPEKAETEWRPALPLRADERQGSRNCLAAA
jgi:signal transduction histidine kinase